VSYYGWKAKFGGMNVSEAQRLKSLEVENAEIKKLLANSMLRIGAIREMAIMLDELSRGVDRRRVHGNCIQPCKLLTGSTAAARCAG
jgi:putative transposase